MPRRVLVVDDESSIREMVSEALTLEGYEVQAVGDGRQALDRLQHATYDCLLVDLRMPGMDGLALYQAVKQFNPKQAGRMVFCTGEIMEGYLLWFVEGTGNRLLLKPVHVTQLLETCQGVCEL